MEPKNIQLKNFINLRMGGFYASYIFIAVIGKHFAAAGLKDLCIEATLIRISSVESMIRGKQYNRRVRALKMVYEALQRLKIEAFERWLKDEQKNDVLLNFLGSSELQDLIDGVTQDSFQTTIAKLDELFELYETFEEKFICSELGLMSFLWNIFFEMVQILLDFIKCTRTGDWSLHMQASERMLKWFFAYDRPNYSRHFTYYWATQQKIKDAHPKIYDQFMLKNFSVKRADGSFNKPPPDQVIEQTINKEQIGARGIIGITTSDGAVQRWVLSSHIMAALISNFKHSLELNQLESNQKDLGKKRIKDDEKVLQDCFNIIKEWGDPFKKSATLIGLSSQIQATEHVIKDMFNAGSIGKDQYLDFIQKRIETNEVDFYAPIKQNKHNTLESAVNMRKVKINGKEVAVRSDRDTFVRLLIMQKNLGHPITRSFTV